MQKKTIILHDYFESLEGGGRLSSVLAEGLNAALACGFATKHHPFTHTARQQGQFYSLDSRSAIPLWRQYRLAQAFQGKTGFLQNYATAIYSGFYSPLAIKQHQQGRNILYCHTPPRFIYDQRDFYLSQIPVPLRPLLNAFSDWLQPRYEQAVQQMDVVIANSQNIQQRIQHYLKQDAQVVYPPCDTQALRWLGQGDYYLSTGRLDPLKRVDRLVQAFLQMPDKKLLITSGGPELKRLQGMAAAADNIQFSGWLDDAALKKLIGNAIATLYIPKDEDFGMSPVESMAAGKPVIGVAEGGLLESIIAEETGFLLPPDPSVEQIIAAVTAMTPQQARFMRSACEKQAQGFDQRYFIEQMREIIWSK
ncbi:glycosyltransferase [Candidatus Venteria ishoeyi]|uniref:glycosyltransferase n=1 Tax=Candidatus Venteria ishoeyi TaxID=1899563 RepID=UPI0025A4FE5A|nr:glycosyltransferase [Candidatus Venteria ishoeyi]MDM8548123.1 glycosyltransferase [Candidatus Venteria ishoeyi]